MTIEHHDLYREFPEYRAVIAALKAADPTFAARMATYDELDAEIHLHENNVAPVADEYLEAKKIRRVQLKDELYAALRTSGLN